ncbi:Putative Aminotransferase [Lysinibacillus sphaericus C3-41]|uniref:Putative Aminotransferase n=1 Tax=Lysinibacillus sphaericus (strain C3-41) TaxID=444177 RepID=B1HXE3_LYSSC|nr:Putative Aminotransferase [Lysinibacillus sphaericus C3-41]
MWVADMDFAAPTAVSKALQEHAERTVLGYSFMSEEAIQSIVDWQNTRHDGK